MKRENTEDKTMMKNLVKKVVTLTMAMRTTSGMKMTTTGMTTTGTKTTINYLSNII